MRPPNQVGPSVFVYIDGTELRRAAGWVIEVDLAIFVKRTLRQPHDFVDADPSVFGAQLVDHAVEANLGGVLQPARVRAAKVVSRNRMASGVKRISSSCSKPVFTKGGAAQAGQGRCDHLAPFLISKRRLKSSASLPGEGGHA